MKPTKSTPLDNEIILDLFGCNANLRFLFRKLLISCFQTSNCSLELYRITKKQGWIAFEVGEVRNGKIKLDEHIAEIGIKAGFECECIMINEQVFTKTANIWGVKNNENGTNSNRIVILKKGEHITWRHIK